MIAAQALGMGRRLAASLMQSTCRIRREGEKVRNPETGMLEPSWTSVYEGPCRVRFSVGAPRETDQAGQRFAEQSPTVWVPIHADGIRVDDVGEILSNTHAPEDVGLTFRVAGVHAQTHSTSRRLPVEILSFA